MGEADRCDRTPRQVDYRRRLLAFTFASARAPSDPRKKATSSSTGTVTGSPLRPDPGGRVRQRRAWFPPSGRRLDDDGHAVLALIRLGLVRVDDRHVHRRARCERSSPGSTVVRKRHAPLASSVTRERPVTTPSANVPPSEASRNVKPDRDLVGDHRIGDRSIGQRVGQRPGHDRRGRHQGIVRAADRDHLGVRHLVDHQRRAPDQIEALAVSGSPRLLPSAVAVFSSRPQSWHPWSRRTG